MAPLLCGHGLHLDGDRAASVVTPPQRAAERILGKPLHTRPVVSENDGAGPVHSSARRWLIPEAVAIARVTDCSEVIPRKELPAPGKNLSDADHKSASGSLPPLSCLPIRDCRSRHGRVSACSRDTAQLSEPMRGQVETEFAQVLRLRDGIAEHRYDASRGAPDS